MSRLLALAALALAAAPASASRGIPNSTVPFDSPERWPYQILSAHLVVHYVEPGDRSMAETVSADLESAWDDQMGQQGARAPLDDRGLAGPDGRLDIYLWRGIDTFYVESVAENPDTWWDDAFTYIVLDPWGQYGGSELAANVYHELRHASQAVDDWWEDYPIFEAEATLWESRAYGFARLPDVWRDFQAHPDWFLFRDDAFRTWFMYGGALYFDFVSLRWFRGGLGFANDMWFLCRNAPGAEFDPVKNEPDFADALDALLGAEGTNFVASVVAFARARWYTGARDIGLFTEGAVVPEVASQVHNRGNKASSSVRAEAMMLGTDYLTVVRGAGDAQEIFLSLRSKAEAAFAVQTLGSGADQVLDLSTGRARLRFGADGKAHLAVTVVPRAGDVFDPDTVRDTRYAADLLFERR